MLQKVEIIDPGRDRPILADEQVDKLEFDAGQREAVDDGKRPAVGPPGAARHHQGDRCRRAPSSRRRRSRRPPACSPRPPSTARSDTLEGLKENVIVGRLIPAGTGAMMTRLREVATRRDELILAQGVGRLAGSGQCGGRHRGSAGRRVRRCDLQESEKAALGRPFSCRGWGRGGLYQALRRPKCTRDQRKLPQSCPATSQLGVDAPGLQRYNPRTFRETVGSNRPSRHVRDLRSETLPHSPPTAKSQVWVMTSVRRGPLKLTRRRRISPQARIRFARDSAQGGSDLQPSESSRLSLRIGTSERCRRSTSSSASRGAP